MYDLQKITCIINCFCCNNKPAIYRGKITHKNAIINVCVCLECSRLSNSKIVAGWLPKGRAVKL